MRQLSLSDCYKYVFGEAIQVLEHSPYEDAVATMRLSIEVDRRVALGNAEWPPLGEASKSNHSGQSDYSGQFEVKSKHERIIASPDCCDDMNEFVQKIAATNDVEHNKTVVSHAL